MIKNIEDLPETRKFSVRGKPKEFGRIAIEVCDGDIEKCKENARKYAKTLKQNNLIKNFRVVKYEEVMIWDGDERKEEVVVLIFVRK